MLKLVIPFRRIAHVPGYGEFKIKGPMITVEADVKKTLNEKILPRQQELIPVALKIKFTYKEKVLQKKCFPQKSNQTSIIPLCYSTFAWIL